MVFLEPITEETQSDLHSTTSGGTRASASHQDCASHISSSDLTDPRNDLTSALRPSSRGKHEEQAESDVPEGIRNNGLKRWWHVMGMSSNSNSSAKHSSSDRHQHHTTSNNRSHRSAAEDFVHFDSGSRSGSESGHSSTLAVDMGDDGIVSHAHGSSINLLPPLDLDTDDDGIGGVGLLYPISSMDNEVGEASESDGVVSLGSLSASSPARSPTRTKPYSGADSPSRGGNGDHTSMTGGVDFGGVNGSDSADVDTSSNERKVSFSQNVQVAKIPVPFGHGGGSPRRSPGRGTKKHLRYATGAHQAHATQGRDELEDTANTNGERNSHLNGDARNADEKARRHCSRSQLLMGFTLLFAFLAIVIGVSVHLINSSDKNGSSSNTNAMGGDGGNGPTLDSTMGKEDDDEFVTDAPTLELEYSGDDGDISSLPVRPTPAPTVDPYRDEILAAADALLRSTSPSTATAIDDESETPQKLAYSWITTWDEANLELDVGQPWQGDHHRNVVSERRYVQRFALGVLYFAMGGKGNEVYNERRLRDVAPKSKATKAKSLHLHVDRTKRERMLQDERLPTIEPPMDEEAYSEPNSIAASDPFHNFLLTSLLSADVKPFLSAYHECQWFGISCKSRSIVDQSTEEEVAGKLEEVVIAIDLSNLGLMGTIPEEIGSLEEIEDLTLYNNDISGTIPPSLMTLPNLFYIDLGSNYLFGSIPPISPTLEYLYLNQNRLSGRIPRGKNGLDYKLKHLWAQQCQLTGPLLDRLGNFGNLEQLVLYENRIIGPIPTTLSSLSMLSYLDLSSNSLTGTVPDTVFDMHELVSIYLSRNQLSGPIVGRASSLSKLSYLWLDENKFSGDIPPAFGDFLNLKSFLLHDNNLQGTMPIQVCDLFGARGELERLEADCAGEFPKLNCSCCTLCW